MSEEAWIESLFEEQRSHLRSVAVRILGSGADADDAVQEAWLRLHRADATTIDNLGGWLTTVVARVCLDMLRVRKMARPAPTVPDNVAPVRAEPRDAGDPEYEALLADSVAVALVIVMDRLTPPERIAFVLHDTFGVPFDTVATVLSCTTDAARQYASRARRRVQGHSDDIDRQRARDHHIVGAFLAAARNGDLRSLIELLHPDAALHADAVAVNAGAAAALGAAAVAEVFAGRARAAELATINGRPGVVWRQNGTPRAAFTFRIEHDQVTRIELVMDPDVLSGTDVVIAE